MCVQFKFIYSGTIRIEEVSLLVRFAHLEVGIHACVVEDKRGVSLWKHSTVQWVSLFIAVCVLQPKALLLASKTGGGGGEGETGTPTPTSAEPQEPMDTSEDQKGAHYDTWFSQSV